MSCNKNLIKANVDLIDSKGENSDQINQEKVCPEKINLQNNPDDCVVKNCKICQCLENKVRLLNQEISLLKNNIKEINENEKKKSQYDQEKNDYIQRLLKTIKKLQLRSSNIVTVNPFLYYENNNCLNEKNNNCSDNQNYEFTLKENLRLEKEIEEMKTNFDSLVDQINLLQIQHSNTMNYEEKISNESVEILEKEKEILLNEMTHLNIEIEMLRKKCCNYETAVQKLINYSSKLSDDPNSTSQENIQDEFCVNIKSKTLPRQYKYKKNDNVKQVPFTTIENKEFKQEKCNLS